MRDVTSDDEANLIVRFAENDLTEDATGMISISMVEYPNYQNVDRIFRRRKARFASIFAARSNWRKKAKTIGKKLKSDLGKIVEGVHDTGFSRGFMAFAPKIIEAIREGKTEIEHAATFEDGLKVQKVLDAAHESNAKKCAVKIKNGAASSIRYESR